MRVLKLYLHRLRRLSDSPHRVARGVFAGTFVAFTPLFGVHLLLAPALAWIIRGNVVASCIATLICNPITFPFIAYVCVKVGQVFIGAEQEVSFSAIAAAIKDLGKLIIELFNGKQADWDAIWILIDGILYPYLIGGVLIGVIASCVAALSSLRIVQAYQRRRNRRQPKR